MSIVSKANTKEPEGVRKLKNAVSESMKTFNANKIKNIRALNSNVDELTQSMKGNVNKIINNASELGDV